MPNKKIEDNSTTAPSSKKGRNDKGQFTKGHKKEGGRKIGTKNKNTSLRDTVKDQCSPLLENLGTELMKIEDPKDRLSTLAQFLPFFLPKYSSTNITADNDRPLSEEEQLAELDQAYTKKQTELSIKTLTIVDNDNGGKRTKLTKKDINPLL